MMIRGDVIELMMILINHIRCVLSYILSMQDILINSPKKKKKSWFN